MLLSIEPLLVKDKSVAPVVKDITAVPGLHQEGFRTKLPFPVLTGPALLGLFLCKDSNKEVRCANKTVISINDILSKYRKDKAGGTPERAVDKVYFFKFLVFDGKGGVYYPAKAMNQETYPQLEAQLLSLGFIREQIAPAIERLRVIHDTLGSRDLVVGKDGALDIVLPRYSQEKCG
jgi:hypothetical protein